MGLSSTKQKTQQQATNTVGPSTYSQPYIDSAAGVLKPAFDAAQANNGKLLDRVNGAMDTSGDYYRSVLGGDYLKANPNLQAVLDATNRDITSGVNSQFEGAGRYGSDYHADTIARALAENEAKLRYGDYQTERGYQQQAASQLPGMTALLSGVSSALPGAAAGDYAQKIAQLLGGYTTGNASSSGTTTTKGSIMDYLLQMQRNAAMASAGG